jgi:hypothetical protein
MAILHDKTRNKDYRIIAGQPSGEGPSLIELHPRSAVVESSGSRLQLKLIPGPAPGVDNAGQQGNGPPESTGQDASAMVSRQREPPFQRGTPPGNAGQAPAEARERQLKARIEAARRRMARQRGNGG